MLERARTNIKEYEARREQERVEYQRKKAEAQRKEAENQRKRDEVYGIFAGIHKDGMAVIQQYYQPTTAPRTPLTGLKELLQRINPRQPEYQYRGYVYVEVEVTGQPTIAIRLDERIRRRGQVQQLMVQVGGIREELVTSVDKAGKSWWGIQYRNVEKHEDPYRNVEKHEDPLGLAQEWRGLMDDVLKLRPIDRAAMGWSHRVS